MTIETVVCDICEATLKPAMHILITCVYYSSVGFVPVQELCLTVEKVSLIFDRVFVERVMTWIYKVISTNRVVITDVFVNHFFSCLSSLGDLLFLFIRLLILLPSRHSPIADCHTSREQESGTCRQHFLLVIHLTR